MKKSVEPLSRSAVMSRVRSKNTRPELRVRKALWAAGLRYRLQGAHLPGRPDIFFQGSRVAVFVHGCFWHRHPGCPRTRTPKSRREFWEAKFASNVARDARNITALEKLGWRVLVIWECEALDDERLRSVVRAVKDLRQGLPGGRPGDKSR